jgi:hypothetical protein
MKHLLWSLILLLFVQCAAYAATCTPTTELARQSRTGMKHRSAGSVNVALHATPIEQMLEWPNPAQIDRQANAPIDPREKQVFTIQGDLWRAKIEDNDCDYHLEITMPGEGKDADRVIVEVPQDSAFMTARTAVRQALLTHGEGDLDIKKSIDLRGSIPIEVTGLAFFDAFHYSRANPKRGHGHGTAMVATLWELHPAWHVKVLTGAPPPVTTTTAVAVTTHPAGHEALSSSPEGEVFSFAVNQSFLASLEDGHNIVPSFDVKLGGHSKVHPIASDCEMHVAAELQSQTFGAPSGLVIEPPNLCTIAPDGSEGGETDAWLAVFDDLKGQSCKVSGFPRIFTEHVTGGQGESNPDHVFELHPAVSIACNGNQMSFASFIKIFPGMRKISPKTTNSCLTERRLEVKFDNEGNRYLFHESGGTCGNFAQIGVEGILPGTVRAPKGGHTAIARITTDGDHVAALKLYTIAGSDIDLWLAAAASNPNLAVGANLHGVITYDYFAMIKLLHPRGQEWQKPPDWIPVPFPFAFVAFGEAADAPLTPSEEP